MTTLTSLLNLNISRANESSVVLHTALVCAIVSLHGKRHRQHVCRLSTGGGSTYSRSWQECPGVHVVVTGVASRYGTGESDCAAQLYPSAGCHDLDFRGHWAERGMEREGVKRAQGPVTACRGSICRILPLQQALLILPLIRDRAHEDQECATGYKLMPYGLMDISELHGMSHAGMSQGPYAGMSQGPYWYEPGTMQV